VFYRTQNEQNIFSEPVANEIYAFLASVKGLKNYTYSKICARKGKDCVVDGEFLLSPQIRGAVAGGQVTWPLWNGIPLANFLAGVVVNAQSVLSSATVLSIAFKLVKSNEDWLKAFQDLAANWKANHTEVVYKTSISLATELQKSIQSKC
jgi:hypothetical protein